MRFMPMWARKWSLPASLSIGAAMVGSAVGGLLLGQLLLGHERERGVPLDEWQPAAAQEPTQSAELDAPVGVSPTSAPAESAPAPVAARTEPAQAPAAQKSDRLQAYSAVQRFSELLHVPAATASPDEAPPQRAAREPRPTHTPKPVSRSKPHPVASAAPARLPAPPASQAPPEAKPAAPKDPESGVVERSYQAITSAPAKVWSSTRDAAKSVASFGEATWDRIKP